MKRNEEVKIENLIEMAKRIDNEYIFPNFPDFLPQTESPEEIERTQKNLVQVGLAINMTEARRFQEIYKKSSSKAIIVLFFEKHPEVKSVTYKRSRYSLDLAYELSKSAAKSKADLVQLIIRGKVF